MHLICFSPSKAETFYRTDLYVKDCNCNVWWRSVPLLRWKDDLSEKKSFDKGHSTHLCCWNGK